jgi:predicted ArsR family transcriptional regulator
MPETNPPITSASAVRPPGGPASRPALTGPQAEGLRPELPHEAAVDAIALLEEPRRRALYELVTSRAEPMGREEAAAALGIGRELAAFHLDRLADAGLLDVEFRRLSGRVGPGAGRPAKLYRRSRNEIAVSLPARDYERAAEVFAEALDHLDPGPRDQAVATVDDIARERGHEAGVAARTRAGKRPGRQQLRAGLIELLGEDGYEPTATDAPATIRLQNCPFHALSATHRDLTCGMNLAWAEGVVDGLGDAGLTATLVPEPGYCCVRFDER